MFKNFQKIETNFQKNENRGKPPHLKLTQLSIPTIWTNQPQCLQLVKLFTEQGRHLALNQLDKNSKQTNKIENQQNIKNLKTIYEYAENAAQKLFKIHQVSKRCVVFFFKTYDMDQQVYNYSEQIYNNKHKEILINLQRLLSIQFMKDLIYILNNLSQIDQIVDKLFMKQDQPSSYSQIIQNFFIKQMIQKMIEENKHPQFSIEVVEKEFNLFLQDETSKQIVRNFIIDIQEIFQIFPNAHKADFLQSEYTENDRYRNQYH